VSALGYTAANGFLKAAAEADLAAIWVSSVKTLPTVVGALPWLIWSWHRGQRLFPARRVVLELLAAGLVGQLAGNVLFQWSLGVVGLAITVPLCFGAIICSSVVLGRIWLHESVTPATLFSVGLIIVAIWILSLSADDAYDPILQQSVAPRLIAMAVVAACCAGSAYGLLGMVIRRASIENASVAATTFLVAGIGAISLNVLSWNYQGWEGIQQTTQGQWTLMISAGICNFIAFVALTRALQITSLIFVNVINASQVAMAAVMGVLIFGEAISLGLFAGAALTIVGLLVMPRKTARPRPYERPRDLESEQGVRKSANLDSSNSNRLSNQADSASKGPGNVSPSTTPAELTLADECPSETE